MRDKAAKSREEILAQCDAKLGGILTALQHQQDTYARNHQNRYWQGLRSASVTPADGEEKKPDIGTRAPADQPEPYPAAIRNANLPFALQVDVYDGPMGQGWTTTVTVGVEGQDFYRVDNEGPESYRVRPWAPVPPRGLP